MTDSSCIHTCSGLMITSYAKTDVDNDFNDLLKEEMNAYKEFKKWFKFSAATAGEFLWCFQFICSNILQNMNMKLS